MKLIDRSIQQPVTVAVGVIVLTLAGLIALDRVPIQLTPDVEDTIISVSTTWEGASPQEVEQEIIDEQEDKLQGIPNLRAMTSKSNQGIGTIRLEFQVGTRKEDALREVSDKLRQVPSYPLGVDEPVIDASDPESRDYIAWIVFKSSDLDFDVRTLQDFAEDRIKPELERVAGISEVNVLGGREREVQIRYDPWRLAQHGVTVDALVRAIQATNLNVSGGDLPEAKSSVRVRTVSQYTGTEQVLDTLVAYRPGGPVHVRDLADAIETFKEPRSFVHSRGETVIAINAQKEVGANIMSVMAGLRAAISDLNRAGGPLELEARRRGLNGELTLTQVYDQTIYIDDALALVQNNIWLGGALAILVLLLFLRSLRPAAIIAFSIPISVVGAVVTMVALGRSVNVISLAGMAFAVGMVVDNAIVVLENIYRHLEMGKKPGRAARDGSVEVWGAVLASTLTTIVVFIPILLVAEEAGQLFRDIALAICAAVGLSLLVSITVIPTCAARLLRARRAPASTAPATGSALEADPDVRTPGQRFGLAPRRWPLALGRFTYWMGGSVLARAAVVVALTFISILGTASLIPPADYLPLGNRNLVFGLMIPPSGYSLEQREELAARVEATVRPYWEAATLPRGSPEHAAASAALPTVPTFDFLRKAPGEPVRPAPLDNYFVVSLEDVMFHGGISQAPERAVDMQPLFQHATRPEVLPGVLAFAFQLPLFRLGGSTGSAVKINLSGPDLDRVSQSAGVVLLQLMQSFGPYAVQPDPSNFNIPAPELQVVPRRVPLANAGLTPQDLALATRTNGDGAFVGEYNLNGDIVDLKLIAEQALGSNPLAAIGDIPIATPAGQIVQLASVAQLLRVATPQQINRVERQRSITLQFTAPPDVPLESAIEQVRQILVEQRALGAIAPDVTTTLTGSASKLAAVQGALLGDGTVLGTMTSSLVLALVAVYLLMCVLFQSFLQPFVILFSVPLATLGGFLALSGVFVWSLGNRYMPVQSLDVLTMLGFMILIGIVVNNAILIIHQSLNFMRGDADRPALEPRHAIAESVRSRVRPIFMSTLTSVLGMAPLVLMPGSGSELYRGLGSVVIGGLLVSTLFTLLLIPALFGLVLDLQRMLGFVRRSVDLGDPTPREALAGGAAGGVAGAGEGSAASGGSGSTGRTGGSPAARGGASPGALAWIAMPLLGSLLLAGCGHTPTVPDTANTTRILQQILEDELARIATPAELTPVTRRDGSLDGPWTFAPGTPPPPASSSTEPSTVPSDSPDSGTGAPAAGARPRLWDRPAARSPPSEPPTSVEDALAALDSESGPGSFEQEAADLPPDLLGEPARGLDLTLEDALRAAAQHNLGLRIEVLEPELAAAGVLVAEANFDPVLFASAEFEKLDQPQRVPVLNGIALGRPVTAHEREALSLGLRQRFATGAVATLSTALERFENDTPGFDLDPDPSYESSLALRIEQPLLRGIGRLVNTADLQLARNQTERARQQLETQLATVLEATEQAYWDLALAQQALLIEQRLLTQGEEVKRVLAARQQFDTDPAQYSDAVATVEERQADLIRSERTLRAASDALKRLLNDPRAPVDGELLLRPAGWIAAADDSIEYRFAVLRALRDRPEVQAALLDIQDAGLREQIARNLERWDLSAFGEISYRGLDDGVRGAYDSLGSDSFFTMIFGLSFELPLRNRAATALRRQRELDQQSALLALREAVQEVITQVKAALRDLHAERELIEATRSLRLAQAENLRALLAAEREQTRMTPEFLNLKFTRQEQLAQAQRDEIGALAGYRKAQAALRRALGRSSIEVRAGTR